MAKVNKNPKRTKPNAKISVSAGYFGLRIKGNLPPHIRKKAVLCGNYWSAYLVEEYFELRQKRVNTKEFAGWYYSTDIIYLFNTNNIDYLLLP